MMREPRHEPLLFAGNHFQEDIMTSIKTIGNIALTIAFVAVALSAAVVPARAQDWDHGRGDDHRDDRGYEHRGHEDYYPPHREYYVEQRGYYPPPPPVVLMPPPMAPGFNIIIPLGR